MLPKPIANLGDVDPIAYGGFFVFPGRYDSRGNMDNDPYCEFFDEPMGGEGDGEDYDDDESTRLVYGFVPEKCTFVNGVLSDDCYHTDFPAWFADDIEALAQFQDTEPGELVRLFCSDNPIDRASAYQSLAQYFGPENLDSYPVRFTVKEIKQRYYLE